MVVTWASKKWGSDQNPWPQSAASDVSVKKDRNYYKLPRSHLAFVCHLIQRLEIITTMKSHGIHLYPKRMFQSKNIFEPSFLLSL